MLFNLAIWEEKVVTNIADFLSWMFPNASSSKFLAILSLAVLLSVSEYNASTTRHFTPDFPNSFNLCNLEELQSQDDYQT